MILTKLNLKRVREFLPLSFFICLHCTPNRNVIITDLNNIKSTYSKILSNQKYGVTFYSLGGKKYKQVNKFRFYHQRENEEIFVIRNDIGGSLVYEGLFRIKNLENHINWLKQNKGYYSEEKNTLVYGEKGIGGTAYNYIKHNKKIKEFIFKKMESFLPT